MLSLRTERSVIFALLLCLIFSGAYLNHAQKRELDETKLPKNVEQNKYFQKWITNHKNKDIPLEADDFRLHEENEVYNTGRLKIFSAIDPTYLALYEQALKDYQKIEDVRFSPNKEQIVDFRHHARKSISGQEYTYYELLYLGRRKDRILENKLLRCSTKTKCFIDRAYFIDDDTIVASTFSLDDSEGSKNIAQDFICTYEEPCDYVVTVFVMNIATNSALVYKSPPMELVLSRKIDGF